MIIQQYIASGRAATGVVGNATSELIDAADLVEFAVTWMGRHLDRPVDGRVPKAG